MRASSKRKGNDAADGIIDIAQRLFDRVGFQKTTVADIARELLMSPANVYRFYAAKSEINEAVGRRLFGEIEAALHRVIEQQGSTKEKLLGFMGAIEQSHAQRLASNSKLHKLLETAFDENWSIARDHVEVLDKALGELICQGQRKAELKAIDADQAARLVRLACIRFWHPRVMVECAEESEPTLDQLVEFCIEALA
jgi:AcrR family transcriptional regulator